MAFLEDPRLRQRWNQISHNAETVTENAAAGIWSFSHNYINPCFASISHSLDQCTATCIGDREERARRRREREQERAEYSFDFYDDWDADDENGGLLGSWSNEDWDRLLAGTGSQRRHVGEVQEQPKRKRGMSYGTRGARRKVSESDPTIIPSTQPIGFLGKLPWKMGKTLRYKPSAADLQDHPRQHGDMGMGEAEPLLGTDSEDDFYPTKATQTRKRSGTTGSGDTSDSFRSRGDLFPSDGEGEEDAVALDDEFQIALDKVGDDRSSSKTKSSKGKRRADERALSRTVSRATIDSAHSRRSPGPRVSSASIPHGSDSPDISSVPSMQDLHLEEARIQREEDEEIERKRIAAAQLAAERGLHDDGPAEPVSEDQPQEDYDEDMPEPPDVEAEDGSLQEEILESRGPPMIQSVTKDGQFIPTEEFIPARLPSFR